MKIVYKLLILVTVLVIGFFGVKYIQKQTQNRAIKLSGRIMRGQYLRNLPVQCTNHYFLVSGNSQTWLIPKTEEQKEWPNKVSNEVFSEVTVSGKKLDDYKPCKYIQEMEECNCDNYLMVDQVKRLDESSPIGEEYTGKLTCLNEVSTDSCIFGFIDNDNTKYTVDPLSQANLSSITIDKPIKILGLTKNEWIVEYGNKVLNILEEIN